MKFKVDPFREMFLGYERLGNEELLVAEQTNITKKFRHLLRNKLTHDHPENISIVIYGPPRDGKSYAAISIGKMIVNYLNTHHKEHFAKEKEVIICRNESEFLERLKNVEFQDVFIIDEKIETMVQEGSYVEQEQMKDVDNICAAKCLTVIRLKPQEIYGTNAMITLKTHGKDRITKTTRLLAKVREMQGERWIGHIVISILPILCDIRKENRYGACSVCPHFLPTEKDIWHCDHFIAEYERRKLEGIDSILEGGSEYRRTLLLELANELSTHEMFIKLRTKEARKLWVSTVVNNKEVLEHATNRKLTISEIDQICAYAGQLHKLSLEDP